MRPFSECLGNPERSNHERTNHERTPHDHSQSHLPPLSCPTSVIGHPSPKFFARGCDLSPLKSQARPIHHGILTGFTGFVPRCVLKMPPGLDAKPDAKGAVKSDGREGVRNGREGVGATSSMQKFPGVPPPKIPGPLTTFIGAGHTVHSVVAYFPTPAIRRKTQNSISSSNAGSARRRPRRRTPPNRPLTATRSRPPGRRAPRPRRGATPSTAGASPPRRRPRQSRSPATKRRPRPTRPRRRE